PDGFTTAGRMIRDLCKAAEEDPNVDAVGMNCMTTARHMVDLLRKIGPLNIPISVMPNASYPTVRGNRSCYDGDPGYFAAQMAVLRDEGAWILGGCCGTTPAYTAATAKALKAPAHIRMEYPLQREKIPQSRPNPFWDVLCDPDRKAIAVELDPPEADVAPGAYSEPFTLRLSGTGTIYYTTDGTPPDTSSNKYSGPINVSWITSIRAICIDGGKRSEEASFFYLVGVEHTLPVVNVAIRPEYLTGPEGVLNHVDPEYEHVSQVTMIEGGSIVFSAPCGFKLHGNDSKLGEKQNFQLRFRSDYGLSTLKCAGLFDNRDADEFNSLLLKGGSEDYIFCGFRDELCTTLVDGCTHLDVLACRPVILYLNGQYHGIYFLRERYDTFRFAQELGGVSKDSVNVLRAYGRVDNGSSEAYTDLLSYCRSHDMTTDASLAYVSEKIDIYSLIDWVVCRSYMDDGDITNIRFYMSEEADGKWRWCYFDLDWAFWHNHTDLIEMIVETGPNSTLLTYLMQNPAFRDMFLRRYAELMGTILNETVIMERIDRFVSMMEPEIAQNQERYGMTVERWYNWLEELRKIIRDGNRSLTVLWNIKNYFELSDTEMADYFGELGFDLTVLDTLPTATPAPDATPSPEPAATPEAT
ncbi:MAG: CotH kinase family protein, partial [Clostridia bacterium]|nr:CotH kinase family protein [Clostridia bacterium]